MLHGDRALGTARSSLAVRTSVVLAGLLVLAALAGCPFGGQPQAPRAQKIPHVVEVHGDTRSDDYFWLRDKSNPKVLAYLKQENAYTEAMTKHTRDLQDKLYDEFVDRLEESETSVPLKQGDYWYYSRSKEDLDYPIHCRKRGTLEAKEEELLDENDLAKEEEFFMLGAILVSPNHERLAYSIDTTGAERFTLHFKELKTGSVWDEKIADTFETIAWSKDGEYLFYAALDKANRPYRAYRHKIGTDPKDDVLIHEEPDEAFFLSLSTTSSEAYVLLDIESNTTREARFLPADKPLAEFTVLQPRQRDLQYLVEHHGDRFLILTNDGAPNFKLVEAPLATPGKEHWREILPARADVKLESFDVFANHVVLTERAAGLPAFEVRDLKTGEMHTITFHEPSYLLEAGPNVEFDTTKFRFSYESFVIPLAVYDYDLAARTRELKKQDKVNGGFDPANYVTERIFASAPDGAKVPVSLVYRKGLARDGANPCLLNGYGSYGMSEDPHFDIDQLSLLDRGFVVAIAHVRGGGELGRSWYDDGKLLKKKNTFTDFIACAEHLIAQKYTSPERLAMTGGSAGGLLVAAVANLRPDLFRAAIADVPFVDVLNSMLDPTIPLTVTEYEEWGNPAEKPYYDVLRSYSPYDNVTAQKYPSLLVIAGLNDTRVAFWEPVKWVAKLRALKTDDHPLLLKTNLSAGHNGASGRYDATSQRAFEFAFLLDQLGVK